MNNEIKGILEYLKDKNDYIEDFGISYKRIHIDNGDLKILLNYITNLQQENDYYFKKNNELSTLNTSLRNDRDDYKSRCEKAVEYIENPRHEMSVLTYQNLLNILQNGSDNNE